MFTREQHAAQLQQHQLETILPTIVVPTVDAQVRLALRKYHQPIQLFGENAHDRRARLRYLVANWKLEGKIIEEFKGEAEEKKVEAKAYLTEGTEKLFEVRRQIAIYSIHAANKRIEDEHHLRKNAQQQSQSQTAILPKVEGSSSGGSFGSIKLQTKMSCVSSIIGDSRPLSSCAFGADNSTIAIASWSGDIKLWSLNTLSTMAVLRGHDWNVSDVLFSPLALNSKDASSFSPYSVNLASAGMDGRICLWPLDQPSSSSSSTNPSTFLASSSTTMNDDKEYEPLESHSMNQSYDLSSSLTSTQVLKPLAVLSGHTNRCSRLAFHPEGSLIASTSYDRTYRLWDITTSQEILCQVGHHYPTYAVAFHADGSLLATGDTGGIGHMWDLRVGRPIMSLTGHASGIISANFHPHGHTLLTSSADHTVRCWDIRKRACIYTLPAHSHLISCALFSSSGRYIVTSGYDGVARVWDGHTLELLSELRGHEKMVMKVDMSKNENYVTTCSYDRTWKLWCWDKMLGVDDEDEDETDNTTVGE